MKNGELTDEYIIAIDSVGAGICETVLITTGSPARLALHNTSAPTDAVIVGIVDWLKEREDAIQEITSELDKVRNKLDEITKAIEAEDIIGVSLKNVADVQHMNIKIIVNQHHIQQTELGNTKQHINVQFVVGVRRIIMKIIAEEHMIIMVNVKNVLNSMKCILC